MDQGMYEPENNKNAPIKGERRQRRRDSQAKDSARSRRSRERRLSVRSELRDTPDMRKIARAVIQMALAEAEKEAQAEKEAASRHAEAEE
jgi:hypothetical protein